MARSRRDWRVLSLVEKPAHATTPSLDGHLPVRGQGAGRASSAAVPCTWCSDVVRPMLEAGERVYAHEFEGYWDGTSAPSAATTPRAWSCCGRRRDSPATTRAGPSSPVTRSGRRCCCTRGAVENSLVANGCRIAGTVINSVLSPGVRVEAGAEVRDSVIHVGRRRRRRRAGGPRHRRQVRAHRRPRHAGVGRQPAGQEYEWLNGLVLVGRTPTSPRARASAARRSSASGGRGARTSPGTSWPPAARSRTVHGSRSAVSTPRYAFILAGAWAAGCACSRSAGQAGGAVRGKYAASSDFPLSNCVNNSGIYDIGVLTQYRPLSLNQHIGTGRPWDLDRTRAGADPAASFNSTRATGTGARRTPSTAT